MGQEASQQRAWQPFPEVLESLTKYDMTAGEGISLAGHAIERPLEEVVALCKSKARDDEEKRKQIQTFCDLADMMVRQEVAPLARDIKQRYLLCAPGEAGDRARAAFAKDREKAAEELEELQVDFLERCCQVLTAADFVAVSAGEWDLAVNDEFMFTLPVKIQWQCFDDKLLGAFLQRHPELKDFTPRFAERILLFRQGYSVVSVKQWLFQEKVDRLLYLVLFEPVLRLAKWLFGLKPDADYADDPTKPRRRRLGLDPVDPTIEPVDFSKALVTTQQGPPQYRKIAPVKKRPADGAAGAGAAGGSSLLGDLTRESGRVMGQALSSGIGFVTKGLQSGRKGRKPKSSRRHQQLVDRRGIQKALPTAWSILKNFHKNVELTEPAFRNVAVIYRNSLAGEREAANNAELSEVAPAVRIKVFQDIPLADLEVVFPFKQVGLKYLNLLTSIISIGVLLGIVYSKLKEGAISLVVVQGIAAVVVAKVMAIFNEVQMARIKMEKEMQRTFVHKSKDNDDGALYYLLQRWEEQELKQLLLSYVYCVVASEEHVLGPGHGADLNDVAAAIEKDLLAVLQVSAMFNVEAAVRRLEFHRLVRRDGAIVFPVPVSEATAVLRETWRSLSQK